MQQFRIRPEEPEDWWEIEALYDLCFAPGREALSSYRLRDDVSPISDLSLVARDGQEILAGAIRFWPVHVGPHDALLLGPVAVHPTHQGEGLGGYLIHTGVEIGRELGCPVWLRPSAGGRDAATDQPRTRSGLGIEARHVGWNPGPSDPLDAMTH